MDAEAQNPDQYSLVKDESWLEARARLLEGIQPLIVDPTAQYTKAGCFRPDKHGNPCRCHVDHDSTTQWGREIHETCSHGVIDHDVSLPPSFSFQQAMAWIDKVRRPTSDCSLALRAMKYRMSGSRSNHPHPARSLVIFRILTGNFLPMETIEAQGKRKKQRKRELSPEEDGEGAGDDDAGGKSKRGKRWQYVF